MKILGILTLTHEKKFLQIQAQQTTYSLKELTVYFYVPYFRLQVHGSAWLINLFSVGIGI